MNKSKIDLKLQFLHTVMITFGLFLINQLIIEQSQENFQQISLTVFQDLMAME
ncbi:MAG: hypothetical protein HC847_23440 [Hydrococcus sp. RU_2_2]|jgi:hypothetical protein|nr:hypothetical protein [Hydrococcus sp. RU_2_2]NJP20546.1 hypothetical protein [Hydrococcus sp. CRU_1_1]NJQ96924.1 hypothetical protein [Hydrococcus sp. CSU_1_8]